MAHRSPFTKEISDEWHRLVFEVEQWPTQTSREPSKEQVKGWERLHERWYKNGRWLAPAPDAGLIASLGITIALRQSRFADAAELARQYLEHPDAWDEDRVNWMTLSSRFGTALVLSGRMEEGLDQLRSVLKEKRYVRPKPASMIRPDLLMLLDDLGSDLPVDPLLREFISSVLAHWKEHRPKSRQALSCATHGELSKIVESTYPRGPVSQPDPKPAESR